MTVQETLAQEEQGRRWAVPATAAAAILPLAASIIGIVIIKNSPHNRPAGVVFLSDHAGALDAASVVLSLGAIGLGFTIVYLERAVRARRPELPRPFRWLGLVGAAGFALVGTLGQVLQGLPPFGVAFQVLTGQKAHDFLTSGGQTWQQARDLFSSGLFAISSLLQALTTFCLAATLIVLALNGVRTGLFTRVFGYIGVFAGILLVIPLGTPVPIVQALWLGGLALLFSGRWPNGVPPAWQTGKAEPWPSLQQQRERAQAGTGSRGGRRQAPAPEPAAPVPPTAAPVGAQTAKRKRKKRR